MQVSDCTFRAVFDGISHRNDACSSVINGNQHGCLRFRLQARYFGFKTAQGDSSRLEHSLVPDHHASTFDLGLNAMPSLCLEPSRFDQTQTTSRRLSPDRFTERMFTTFLNTRCQAEQFVRGQSSIVCGHNIRHRRLSLRDRSGFIQHNYRDFACTFKGFTISKQDARFSAFARSHHDGGWSRKPHCAWTSDDQHRDGINERAGEIINIRIDRQLRTEEVPT